MESPSLFPPGMDGFFLNLALFFGVFYLRMEGFVEGRLVAKGKLHPQDFFFGRQSPGLKWSLL